MSRPVRCRNSAAKAAAPRVMTPASRNRAVSSRSGGQSNSASLATAKAELQIKQKVAIASGNRAREGSKRSERITRFLSAIDVRALLAIWKLNDTIHTIHKSNG